MRKLYKFLERRSRFYDNILLGLNKNRVLELKHSLNNQTLSKGNRIHFLVNLTFDLNKLNNHR